MKRTAITQPVYIVEDQAAHRRVLRDALRHLSPAIDIKEFDSYESAWKAFEEALRAERHAVDLSSVRDTEANSAELERPRAKRAQVSPTTERMRLPVAIVADIGLQHEIENGMALLGRAFRAMAEELGTGLWTIAVTAHPLAKVPHERPYIPHALLQKDSRGEWGRLVARLVGPLLAKSIPTDVADNDLAPSSPCPPSERVYLYERGDAIYANNAVDGRQFDECFDLGLVQPHLRELRELACPVAMYRGRYVPLNKYSMAKVPRALLRARTVLTARRQSAFVVELMSIDGNGNLDDSPGGDGIPLASVNNFFTWLRSELKPLVTQGLGLDPRIAIPALTGYSEWRNTSRVVFESDRRQRASVAVAEHWSKSPTLACPRDIATSDATQGVMARLHFVLSRREVANYRQWKAAWTSNAKRWEALYDTDAR